MQAIINDVNRRIEKMERFNFTNKKRRAIVELLEQLNEAIDSFQKHVQHSFSVVQWYSNKGMNATAKQRFHDWQIQKAVLTRLQSRYKKTLELLIKTP